MVAAVAVSVMLVDLVAVAVAVVLVVIVVESSGFTSSFSQFYLKYNFRPF